jgi:glucose 1-dehydrogenase
MCRNNQFTERGILRRDGCGSERWRVEPASVLAKAWEQVDRISQREFFVGRRALVTGAGPIGLLACLFGVQRGLEMHVSMWTSTLSSNAPGSASLSGPRLGGWRAAGSCA